MAKFYRMAAHTNVEDFVRPGEQIQPIAFACQTSSFQFLDHAPLAVEISEDGGMTFPDFLYNDGIPLVSYAFKRVLDTQGVDNLFYKPIDLVDAATGIHEEYTLALPPRIRAVRKEDMHFEEEYEAWELNTDEYGIPRYKINALAVGNYRMFKLADVWNYDIIVTKDLKEAFTKASLQNVFFSEIEEG